MKDFINISKLKGKRLKRFVSIIDKLKPGAAAGTKIKEWRSIKDNTRRVARINAFLSMNAFTAAELKVIKKYVFRIVIPWRLIIFLLFLGVAAFVAVQYMAFQKIPMVYAYGNDLKIYTSDDENASTNGQLDIYGKKFVNGQLENSAYKTLLIDSSGSFLSIRKNSFIQWLFNKKPDGYMKRNGLLFSKNEYDDYEKFFMSINGSSCLHEIPNEIKKTFFSGVNREYPGAVLANDYRDDEAPTGFFRALYQTTWDSTCVLFRLADASGTKKNLVMRIAPGGYSNLLPLMENGRPLTNAGLFKIVPGNRFPDILFYKTDTKKTVKSLLFPYDQYQ